MPEVLKNPSINYATKTKRCKVFSSDVTVVEGERAVSATISTTAVDRDHEVLIPQGCNWKDYQLNPVVYWNHSYSGWEVERADTIPVGQCLALKRTDDEIQFKMTFAQRPADHPADAEWFPDTLFALYQQGVLRAFSVGFLPIEGRAANDRDLENFGADARWITTKWKLMEVSCVGLPANQEAVALAVSKGLIKPDQAKQLTDAAKLTAEHGSAGSPAAKADDPKMGTCSKCEKEFPLDDLDEVDGSLYCDDCMPEEKSADVTAPDADAGDEKSDAVPAPKRVVAEVEGLTQAAPVKVKRVRRELDELPKPRPVAKVKKLIIDETTLAIHKMRGRIYR